MSTSKLPRITKAGFVLRPDTPSLKPVFEKVRAQFEERGIEVVLSTPSAALIGAEGIEFEAMCDMCDFLVSLGGDGTMLSLVRRSYGSDKPVLGINAGNLGFLADITQDDVNIFLDQLFAGEYRIDERMMIEGYIVRNKKRHYFYAFNDVVITRDTVSKMAEIDAYINKERFNTLRGDGLIVSTATGSTAYNLAAGGPILYPLTKAFILTPICAHSLTQRPVVVPADFMIGLRSPGDRVIVMVDGQDSYELEPDELLVIKGAKEDAKVLHRKERNYFAVLSEKLSWGDKR